MNQAEEEGESEEDEGEGEKGKKFPPTELTPTGEVEIEPSTQRGNRGGESIQEVFIDENGNLWTRHTVVDKNGRPVEKPHYRPGGPK